jgi:hypothetical protein
MKNQISPKMDEFIDKIDQLCREYGYEEDELKGQISLSDWIINSDQDISIITK